MPTLITDTYSKYIFYFRRTSKCFLKWLYTTAYSYTESKSPVLILIIVITLWFHIDFKYLLFLLHMFELCFCCCFCIFIVFILTAQMYIICIEWSQKRVSNSLEVKLQMWAIMCVLRIKPKSSARAASLHNH